MLTYPYPNVCKIMPFSSTQNEKFVLILHLLLTQKKKTYFSSERSVVYEGTPKYFIKEKNVYVEVYDSTFYFFGLDSTGTPFRGEYVVYDLNSWARFSEKPIVTVEQFDIPALTSHIVDTANRRHTFSTTMDNGAEFATTLVFDDTSAYINLTTLFSSDLTSHLTER